MELESKMSMVQSMDCFHADEFCPYGKKNCLFSHGPDDQGSDSVGILFSFWAISWGMGQNFEIFWRFLEKCKIF